MIADLINTNRTWKSSGIWSLYPVKEAKEILATHIPREEEDDKLGWSLTKSGNFTVKTGYWFLQNKTNGQIEKSNFWKQFWKSDIFLKWKLFL